MRLRLFARVCAYVRMWVDLTVRMCVCAYVRMFRSIAFEDAIALTVLDRVTKRCLTNVVEEDHLHFKMLRLRFSNLNRI